MIRKEKDGTDITRKSGIQFPSLLQKSKMQAEYYFFYNKAHEKCIISAPVPTMSDSERKQASFKKVV